MKCLFYLTIFFSLYSCSNHLATSNDNLICLQIVDRNDISETISNGEKLKKYNHSDFLSSQPYKQVVQIFQKNDQGKTPSIITSYHPNGCVWQYLNVIDSRAHGEYIEWHTNGQKKIKATVIGGPADLSYSSQQQWLFDHISTVWDKNGFLLATLSYDKGVLEGLSTYYFPSGKIKKTIPYHQNEIDGMAYEYNENNEVITKTSYKNGVIEGTVEGFWSNNQPSYIEEFNNGLLLEGQYFDKQNKLLSSIHQQDGIKTEFINESQYQMSEYHNGQPEGKIEIFSSKTNHLLHSYNVINGKKEGQEIIYYPKSAIDKDIDLQLIPKCSFYWKNDSIDGVVKTWYNDGTLESQKEYRKNKKNGPSCAWYKNGNIMLIEEYEDDELFEGKYYKKNHNTPISSVSNGNGIATIFDADGYLINKISYEKGKALE